MASFSAGKPKGVPAHRMQHIVAPHAHQPRHRVARDVVPTVPDRQPVARRVGKKRQHIALGLAGVFLRAEQARRLPALLPFRLDLFGVVCLRHRLPITSRGANCT
jgi:hypothetical protein